MKKMFLAPLAALLALVSCAPKHAVGIVAHRGYWNCGEGGMSHNSIASLKAACEHGFWGTEFDVNMTADGELLVYHDSEIEGKRINFTDKADLDYFRLPNGEPVPTLDEYLAVAKDYPKTKLVLELKSHASKELEDRAVDGVVASLEKAGLFTPGRVMFISFSLRECSLFAQKAPGFTVQYLAADKTFDEMDGAGVNGIDMYFPTYLGDPQWKEGARADGYSINVWTVDGEDDIRKCIDTGIDQITTNNPELVRSILAGMEGYREARN